MEKVVHVTEPVFAELTDKELVDIGGVEEPEKRKFTPGFTPAGFSLAGTATAVLWYREKIEEVLGEYVHDRETSRVVKKKK